MNNVTAQSLSAMLGARLRTARLNKNFTMDDLALNCGLSYNAIKSVELGTAKLSTVMSVLIALDLVEQLDLFIPPQETSPIQLAKLQGSTRQRATKSSKKVTKEKHSW